MAQSVVVLERDPNLVRSLVGKLSSHFLAVHLAQSRDELREKVAASQPGAVVLNIETWRLSDVETLRRDFPALPIICTHRVPDEEMWMAALAVGASDVCPADDPGIVLTSVLRTMALAKGASA
jgi:DNA-binding response OmpR family regulator